MSWQIFKQDEQFSVIMGLGRAYHWDILYTSESLRKIAVLENDADSSMRNNEKDRTVHT